MKHHGPQRALVLGATGFIGSAIVSALLKAGWSVTGVCRPGGRKIERVHSQLRERELDLSARPSLKAELAAFDAIVIAAAVYGRDSATFDLFLLEEALAGSVDTGAMVAYTSGAAVYGSLDSTVETEEAAEIQPLKLVAHRAEAEGRIAKANADGARAISIRPGWVWGSPDALIARVVRRLTVEGRSVRLPGAQHGVVPFVHRDDLAALYVSILESDAKITAVNAASQHLERGQIAQVFGYGAYSETPAAEAAELVGPIAELLAQSIRLSSARAHDLLGWRPEHHLTT